MIGWDIGGVNTKVARVENGEILFACGRPFELQRAAGRLVPLLRELGSEAGLSDDRDGVRHAVTMTAELSQMFRTKREGVAFVLDALTTAFPSQDMRVFAVDGGFLTPAEARADPLAVAAANWAATAHYVALHHPDALLIDIGTTTTDIIPIVAGVVVAEGRTDPGRLASGELVYTGALRTPVEAIAGDVRIGGETIGVSAEGFAIAGDVHVWRGDLSPDDYTVPAPDGRPAAREFAGERLARVICADREMLDETAISALADAVARAQMTRIVAAIRRVIGRHPSLVTAVVTGLGAFLGKEAARAAGLDVVALAAEVGDAAARCAPATAVALLLDRPRTATREPQVASPEPRVPSGESRAASLESRVPSCEPRLDVVVKIGGGLLAQPSCFDAVIKTVGNAARDRRLLVVPGGGPFADAVRAVDDRLHLSHESAHWMAVLAMDQYAQLIVDRLEGSALVSDSREIAEAVAAGRVPVLAPSRWLRAADPLPHSWDVTSDSIAGWVAGSLGARRLVLVKPAGAAGKALVDPYFSRAVPPDLQSVTVPADETAALLSFLHG